MPMNIENLPMNEMKTQMKRIFLMLCVVVYSLLVCFAASAEIIRSGNCGQSGEDLQFTLDDPGRGQVILTDG